MLKLLDCSYREIVLDYILAHEIELVMIYGNVLAFGLKNHPEIKRCADYYGYFEGEKLKGFIAFYNLGSCIPHYSDPRAIAEFVELMKTRSFEVVIGMHHIVKPIMDQLQSSKPCKGIDEEMYMVNEDFKPYSNQDFTVRSIDAKDERDMNFCARIRRECFDEKATPEEQREFIRQKPNDEEFLLACHKGEPIAQAIVHGYTPHYAQIGAVGTLPEHRSKGASKAVVSRICQCIVNKKRIPSLMVRKNNAPAVKVYETLGFKNYDDYLMVWY